MLYNNKMKPFYLGDKLPKEKAANMNAVVLAFVGDAVYSLYVREKLAFSSDAKAGELNRLATAEVKAAAQAAFIAELIPRLTEEELAIYKRARNSKKGTKSKSSSVQEYNMSTGFEAVVGYLYVTGETERLNELLNFKVKT